MDFDFISAMTDMLSGLIAFIFEWIGRALSDAGRAHMDDTIR